MKPPGLLLLTLVVATALVSLACGGGDGASSPSPMATSTSPPATATSVPPTAVSETPIFAATEPPATPTGGDPKAGAVLFTTARPMACSACHALDDSVIIGPGQRGIATRAASRVPGLSAEEYIRQSILDPGAFVVTDFAPIMPTGFAETLSAKQVDDLVAYLLTLE